MTDIMVEKESFNKKRSSEEVEAEAEATTAETANDPLVQEEDQLSQDSQEVDDDVQPPCAKKPKLSRKELLEQAKARLKEAQEKQKSLLERLEEEKTKPPDEQQSQAGEDEASGEYDQEDYDPDYDEYDDYYYGYEYHVPPVTGARESLLLTNLERTGPADKVRFITLPPDSNNKPQLSCIEAVLQVINGRRRALSPMNGAAQETNSQDGEKDKHQKDDTANGESKMHQPQHTDGKKDLPPEPPQPKNGGPAAAESPPKTRDLDLKRKRNEAIMNSALQSKRGSDYPPLQQRVLRGAKPPPHPPPSSASSAASASGSPSKDSQPPLRACINPVHSNNSLPRQPRTVPSTANASLSTSSSAAPKPPPWKRCLAQITGKTLDCVLELPSKTTYMIRTQDQGVVAHVQFFSMPNNPTLLEHHPSKRALVDHFQPVSRLPSCNTTSTNNTNNSNTRQQQNQQQAWKGQEVLSFLKHQDERRTTYQPPARRNLPLTHWAVLEMIDGPLLKPPDSLGYFTATPAADNSITKNSKNDKSDDKSDDSNIGFAGKLVWNFGGEPPLSRSRNVKQSKVNKWGEIVTAVTTTGIQNSPLIATIQGFYEGPHPPPNSSSAGDDPHMPPSLRARKVILPKSRTIGIIIGASSASDMAHIKPNNNNNAANNNNAKTQQQQFSGCCQVLFPNGMASGPFSVRALEGARAILYD